MGLQSAVSLPLAVASRYIRVGMSSAVSAYPVIRPERITQ